MIAYSFVVVSGRQTLTMLGRAEIGPMVLGDTAHNGWWIARLGAARGCGIVHGGWAPFEAQAEQRLFEDGNAVCEELIC